MNYQLFKKVLLSLFTLSLCFESSAFTLIVNGEIKYNHFGIFEHLGTSPQKLENRSTELKLDNYPNAIYFIYSKSIKTNIAIKPQFLGMIWVESDTSKIEISIDGEHTIQFKEENEYQRELNEIFKSSNVMSLFPYEPSQEKPLQPILALEAKAIIQNLDATTERSVLTNLYDLAKQRNIDNWSTEVLSAFLNESSNEIYSANSLVKLFGFDSLQNKIVIKPDNDKHIFIALSGSWCGPCFKGIPKLKKMYDENNDEVVFVNLWNDPDFRTYKNVLKDIKQLISWASLWDQYGLVSNALQTKTYPTYILFDPSGKELKRWEGKLPNKLTY